MRSLFLLLLLAALASLTEARLTGSISHDIIKRDNSMCAIVEPDLPQECTCTEDAAGPLSFGVECLKVFNDTMINDTVGIDLTVAPCDKQGSSISLNITEENHGINLQIAGIRAGDEVNLPIPGLSAIVPGIGSIGVDAAIMIFGNPDELTLKVGLNACAMIHTHEVCASAIPGLNMILPWWILKGTYSFGDFCNATSSEVLMQ